MSQSDQPISKPKAFITITPRPNRPPLTDSDFQAIAQHIVTQLSTPTQTRPQAIRRSLRTLVKAIFNI